MINKLINIVFWGCMLVCFWFFLQIFVFTSFKIPSDSMEPELITGDNILVGKAIPGARLFNIFASMRNEQVDIYRTPGIRKIRHNDVVVFNFPHPNNWDKVEMHILKYYIKRCVGLPGDTLTIENGIFRVKNIDYPLGNILSQKRIEKRDEESFDPNVLRSFPFDSNLNWNIKNFGPLHIPKSGDRIAMNSTNYCLYKKLIEWEQNGKLEYRDDSVYLDNKPIATYQFKKNYYFMAGDNGENSQDSRYWGMLPEEYIVGKAWIIWKSINSYTEKFRWDRFLKTIN